MEPSIKTSSITTVLWLSIFGIPEYLVHFSKIPIIFSNNAFYGFLEKYLL